MASNKQVAEIYDELAKKETLTMAKDDEYAIKQFKRGDIAKVLNRTRDGVMLEFDEGRPGNFIFECGLDYLVEGREALEALEKV